MKCLKKIICMTLFTLPKVGKARDYQRGLYIANSEANVTTAKI